MRERGEGGGTALGGTNDVLFLLGVGGEGEVDKVKSCEELEGFVCSRTLFLRCFMNCTGLDGSEKEKALSDVSGLFLSERFSLFLGKRGMLMLRAGPSLAKFLPTTLFTGWST